MLRTKLFLYIVLVFLMGCHVTFAEQKSTCEPNSNGQYADTISAESGGDEDSEMWSKGGGCIFRPIKEVWSVLHQHEKMKWEGVDEIDPQSQTPPEGFSHFYRIEYIVHALGGLFDVKWTMDWLHKLSQGTLLKPERVQVEYKIFKDNRYIKKMQGTFVLIHLKSDPVVTEFRMEHVVMASRTTLEDMKETIKQVTHKLRDTTLPKPIVQP